MGISCITRNTNCILPFLLLILIITPSSSSLSPKDIVTKELLNKFCSGSDITNPNLCLKWLSRTTSISINGLINLTVKETREFGLKNQALMSKLAKSSGKDPNLKESYEACVDSHGEAIKELEKAQKFLSSSSFKQAVSPISSAFDKASDCKDAFEGPSNEPPMVWNRIEDFTFMCYIDWSLAQLVN